MAYGMKVSKSGYNVLTTGNANLSFNSELATHSVYSTTDTTLESGNSSVSINHSLGYVPKAWVFYDDGTSLTRVPVFDWGNGIYLDYYISSSAVVVETADDTQDYDLKVVIFTRKPTI